MTHVETIARQLSLRPTQVSAVINLLDEQNTIPFIARYRKEATGSLDEEQLRQVEEQLGRLRSLDERRAVVLKSIGEQEKLTPELEQQINAAETLTALEDLYQPYKPKRRTRASTARERGLQPLADLIMQQPGGNLDLAAVAQPFLGDEVADTDAAWAGGRDIVAEAISDHSDVRRLVREQAMRAGLLHSEKLPDAEDPRQVYDMYYAFELRVDRLRPHQVLAINRGEQEKVLRVSLLLSEGDWRSAVLRYYAPSPASALAVQLSQAIQDAAERLLLPAIERDVRRFLTEMGENQAIRVFADNLRALLGQPPLSGFIVLGIDPGFRTGCKVAVVDQTGKLLDTATIYPHEPKPDPAGAAQVLRRLIVKHRVNLVVMGNGTASRETEAFVAAFLQKARAELPAQVRYLIVNEAGASVYSASPLARAELPDLDVSLRGAVSIARRVLDPLAELVKIEPKAIGVGMYQHDVNQKKLAETLEGVVESVVNQVGVDLNTASPALLTHVAGIGPKLAGAIVAYRDEHGPFGERGELREVTGMGPKAFQQCAGFLRIRAGRQPLDASAIHPESYPAAQAVMQLAGLEHGMSPTDRQQAIEALLKRRALPALAAQVGVGAPTLKDILEQLVRPGRDPRLDAPPPILREDVLHMEDLQPGMRLRGTVRNVVDFGAFIDIGVKQDGLLHRSQVPAGTVYKVGDILEVEIVKVEVERGRIGLALPKQG